MNISVPRRILTATTPLVLLVSAMIMSNSSFARNHSGQVNPSNDSIVVQKRMLSKTHKVTLYPDAMQKVLFFTVKGEEGKVYQLYVFDLDGNLVKQTEIRNKQTTFIEKIDKGVYLFDVFCDDDRIGNGQIAVR